MSLKHLLNQSLTRYSQSGYGADGTPSVGTGTTVKCRFEPLVKRMLMPNGQVLLIDATVIVDGAQTFNTNDKVNFDSHDYKVVDVFEVPDDLGNIHHVELRLTKWH